MVGKFTGQPRRHIAGIGDVGNCGRIGWPLGKGKDAELPVVCRFGLGIVGLLGARASRLGLAADRWWITESQTISRSQVRSQQTKGIVMNNVTRRLFLGRLFSSPANSAVACLLTALLMITQTGCLGLAANLMNVVKGYTIDPEYTGFEDKRVAVVCVTDSSQYSDDTSARILSRRVSEILQAKVKKIELVREDEVQQWRDRNGWDAIEFIDIGKGVKADKVLAIEMTNLRLRDGATLYRGRASVTVTAYDVESKQQEFRKHLDEFTYPETAGQYTSETTETKFRTLYLSVLALKIGRYFHGYDYSDTVAMDATIITQ